MTVPPSKGPAGKRTIGHLTFQEVGSALRETSILCLPMGSMEQHGPHLPLNTDAVLAEAFTRRIVERWGDAYDLWQLPPLAVGLSREHDWAPGTLSLSVSGMTAYLRDLGREIARSLPARNLLVVNGHGGNRGMLEAIGRELRGDFGLNIGALHLGAMMSPVTDAAVPEIHAGRDETSAMLALAPDLVRQERMREATRAVRRRRHSFAGARSGNELAVVERRQADRGARRDGRCARGFGGARQGDRGARGRGGRAGASAIAGKPGRQRAEAARFQKNGRAGSRGRPNSMRPKCP